MKEVMQTPLRINSRRRYLVQLLCVRGDEHESRSYFVRIRPWSARGNSRAKTMERVFADEWELIDVVNPLLPRSSDVRDVMEHIESPNGFFYLLRLSSEEAAQLGGRREIDEDGVK